MAQSESAHFPAPLVLKVFGRLEMHPWIAADHRAGRLEEDLFSLVVGRTMAYGWADFGSGLGGTRWGHNDAGGDWTQDGAVREIAWLQVDCAGAPAGQRLPLTPLGLVLGECLDRLGSHQVEALEASLPVSESVAALGDLAYAATWAGLADPAGRVECRVTVDGGVPLDACRARAWGAVEFHQDGPDLRCVLREWSLSSAIWLLEIITDALREASAIGTRVRIARE
ncbi:hypothetical protein [Streptomyces sp. NPDC018693]|uniref:hypothetical protein n=1 Tax=unclassified Streptomyces TaxID=2593676 RepID=UPI00379F8936